MRTSFVTSLRQALRARGGRAAGIATAVVVVMWVLEILDTLLAHRLDSLGITSWNFFDLPSLVTAPFVHVGFDHLLANTLPFFVLAVLILLSSVLRWLQVTGITALTSGLFAFFVNPPHVNTEGMSGVIFGYVTYLIARGVLTRRWTQLLLGVAILVAYGSVLWGVLPLNPGVSWQGHLGGAAGGVLAAWLLHRRERDAQVPVI